MATFRIDLSGARSSGGARARVVPGVGQFPGFMSPHWTVDRYASETLVFLTYESLAAAEAMSFNVKGNSDNQRRVHLDLGDVRIVEIAGNRGPTAMYDHGRRVPTPLRVRSGEGAP